MSHAPVSVVIAAGGSPDDLYACLHSLRPNLGTRDEVVCVLPSGRDDLAPELRGQPWVRVIEDGSDDPGARWAAGVAATTHPLLVLLDGDTVLPAHWLDTIIAPFDAPDVVATGPRCHHSFGPQQADVPDSALESPAAFKTYARRWREQHKNKVTEVTQLGPVCAAFRRDALARAGGPTADLPYEELAKLGRILLTHSSLMAHVASGECSLSRSGADQDVLLSATLIVKDEEEVLASCLSALDGLVDEIVVYDTGSTDRSRDIAREHGARVIEGYWDDDFGGARSRALAHCRGQWALWVDADEVAAGDAGALRPLLASTDDRDAFMIRIRSQEGHAGGFGTSAHLYPRLFRWAKHRVYGRLHEQVVDRVNGRVANGFEMMELVLDHSGYTPVRAITKDKGVRNLRLAELAAEDTGALHSVANLARSQMATGKFEQAIEACHRGLSTATEHLHRVTLLKILVDAQTSANRLDDANETLRELRGIVKVPVTADEHEIRLRYAEQNNDRVLELVDAMPESAISDTLFAVHREHYQHLAINCLSRLGRHTEAASRLRESIRGGKLPLPLMRMTQVLSAEGSGVAEIAELAPRESLHALLLSASEAPAALADELLEALWQRYPGNSGMLALAARIGGRVSVLRSMEWSARLREQGYHDQCTLLALAANPDRTPRERSLSAAIAVELFGDADAMPLLEQALASVPDNHAAAVLDEMRLLAPGVAASIEFADA